MKKFLLKILLFSLPLALFLIFLEITLRQIPNDYKFKNEYFQQHSNQIEKLILGSSHSFYGLDPAYFSGTTFNASHISQSIDLDYLILMKYKDSLKSLKTIYLPISYFSLWEKLGDDTESWRCKNYLLYYDINQNYSFTKYSEVLSIQFRKNISRASNYLFKNESEVSCSNLGWGTSYTSEKSRNLTTNGKYAAINHTYPIFDAGKFEENYKENVFTLNKLIEWSTSKGIEVVLFTPPAFETYRKYLDPKQLAITIETSEKIASKHDNCKYFNMISDSTFVAKDYFDADHMSEIGAKKLSELLDKK